MAETVALILFAGVVLYATFGGADFGVGIWDLTAGDDRKGGSLRSLIDRSIGPVWEANHVWLIFVLVYMWTGFPGAFASFAETLWIPLSIAGLGIVARGSAFAFRKFAPSMAYARLYGVFFALSSMITPFFFGTIAGAMASGRVPADNGGDVWTSWTGPTSMIGGVIAVLACAFLAAVLLTFEAHRGDDNALLATCRKRAIASGVVTGAVALACVRLLNDDAPTLFDGLTGKGLPFVLLSAAGGLVTIIGLLKARYALARAAAFVAVACVVLGWGVGQYPFIVADTITIQDSAGAHATLVGLVAVFGLAAVTVVPSLIYLYRITQKASWLESDH